MKRPILKKPNRKGGLGIYTRNKTQLCLKFFEKLRRVENVPCCYKRSVTELTDPREIASPVVALNDGGGKPAEEAPPEHRGPLEGLLPIHPAILVV